MNIDINSYTGGNTAFFTVDNQKYALTLGRHTLHYCCSEYGSIEAEQVPKYLMAFDVEQDYENELTSFVFEDFTLIYDGSTIKLK